MRGCCHGHFSYRKNHNMGTQSCSCPSRKPRVAVVPIVIESLRRVLWLLFWLLLVLLLVLPPGAMLISMTVDRLPLPTDRTVPTLVVAGVVALLAINQWLTCRFTAVDAMHDNSLMLRFGTST